MMYMILTIPVYVVLLLVISAMVASLAIGTGYAFWKSILFVFRNHVIYFLVLIGAIIILFMIDSLFLGVIMVLLAISLLCGGLVYALIYWLTIFPQHFKKWHTLPLWTRILSLAVPLDFITGLLLQQTR